MDIDTRTLPNFLSASEVDFVKNYMKRTDVDFMQYDDYHPKTGNFVCYTRNLFPDQHKEIYELIMPRIYQKFSPKLKIQDVHVLYSSEPYGIHSDVLSGDWHNYTSTVPAWTFIIPLDNYDSSTVVFEQSSPDIKIVSEWVAATGAPKLNVITEEQIEKYFSHLPRTDLEYLSIEDIFPWTKGSLFAASRSKFHTSDNYIKNGIPGKEGIIIWTYFAD